MYDCIVVGAGPAGASTAFELAKAGLRVLILEREKLPRYKTCGGGIPLNFFKTLPERVQSTLETVMTRCGFLGPEGKTFQLDDFSPVAGVMREKFDYEFAMAACDEGADLLEESPVLTVEEKDRSVIVRTEKTTFEALFLVGADGAASLVKKNLNPHHPSSYVPAIEAEVRFLNVEPDKTTAKIHLGWLRNGYAWAFPKREVMSLGVGSFGDDRSQLNQKLRSWVELCGYSLDGARTRGCVIPLWQGRERLSTRRTLLVGDAAGTVDPLTGEGIRHSILSGRIAAAHIQKAIVGGAIEGHDSAIYEAVQKDFRFARWFMSIFYRFPKTFFKLLMRSPRAAGSMGKILAGQLHYRDVFRKGLRMLFSPWRWTKFRD